MEAAWEGYLPNPPISVNILLWQIHGGNDLYQCISINDLHHHNIQCPIDHRDLLYDRIHWADDLLHGGEWKPSGING
jgi:hypothetical protein